MKTIYTSRNESIFVDDEDFEYLNQWKWQIDKDGYAVRNSSINGKGITLRIHRIVTGAPQGMQVDHINGLKHDNRRSNLRICIHQQNAKNRPGSKQLKGVHRIIDSKFKGKRVQSAIRVDGKQIYLGTFSSEIEAHQAYCEAAKKYHGEFSNLKSK